MADQDPSNILDFLRGRFDRLDQHFEVLERKTDEIITRLTRAPRELVDLRRDILGLHEDG